MNSQQRLILEMMSEIHDICVANDITYFIASGTLIGAVRNEGFLPWDDDADLMMTYDNWQRFKEVCRTQLPANRYLGTAEMQESYGHLISRYVSRDTTTIHTSQSLHDDVAGEIVDIFVLDPVADGDEAYTAYVKDLLLYSSVVNYANAAGAKVEVDPDKLKYYLERMHTEGKVAVVREIESMLASHFDEKGKRYVHRWQGMPITYQREWFAEVVMLPFEGLRFMAPKGINEILTRYYGEEWPNIPNVINPAKHNVAHSLRFPYTEALEFFEPKYDRNELLRETEERRLLALRTAPVNNRIRDSKATAKAQIVGAETMDAIARYKDDFDSAYEAEDITALSSFVDTYLQWQTSPEMIGRHSSKGLYRYLRPLLVPVSDEAFGALLLVLITNQRIGFASRLLRIRRREGLPVTGKILEVEGALEKLRASMNAYQYGEFTQGASDALAIVERFPYVAWFRKIACMHLWKLYETETTPQNLETFRTAFTEGLELFPGDGFFEKLQADWLGATGKDEQARELYLQAAERTRNGLALLDIYKKTGYFPSWLRNPQWAKEAEVPQWSGPEPCLEGLPQPQPSMVKPLPDTRLECLVNLMGEVVSACARIGAPCALGPAATQALAVQGKPPLDIEDYLIICHPAYMTKLVRELQNAEGEARFIEYLGSGANLNQRFALRYHDTTTLLLNLKAKAVPSCPSLYVTIAPLEPEAYRSALPRAVCASKRAGSNRILRKLVRTSPLAAKRCFANAMAEAAKSAPETFAGRSERLRCSEALLFDTHPVSFGKWEFPVPRDLDSYLAAIEQGQATVNGMLDIEYLQTSSMTYEDLIDSGALPQEFFQLKEQVRELNKRDKVLLKRFQDNFSDVKAAVALKDKIYSETEGSSAL